MINVTAEQGLRRTCPDCRQEIYVIPDVHGHEVRLEIDATCFRAAPDLCNHFSAAPADAYVDHRYVCIKGERLEKILAAIVEKRVDQRFAGKRK